MKAREFPILLEAAVRQLTKLNADCEREFRISTCQRWRYDLDRGTLTFSLNGVPKVRALIEVIGTASNAAHTWRWAWASANLPRNVTGAARLVRAFGEREKLPQLTAESIANDDYLGWEMTALAAKLVGAQGAYRCQDDRQFLYVIYSSIGFVSEPERGAKEVDFGTTRLAPGGKN